MVDGAMSYQKYLDGDNTGLLEIIQEYKNSLMYYLNTYVHNLEAAEELTEDTFFKIMVRKPFFKPKGSFKSWLFTIGRNLALDYLRKSVSRKEEYNDEIIYEDKEGISRETKELVWKVLKRLPDNYRQVLYLNYFEDFSNTEIASIMHKTNRQIETLLYRAKKAMKEELGKEGYDYEDN